MIPVRWLSRCLGLLLAAQTANHAANPEAFLVGPERADDLPGGKEADGIVGDFLLRNEQIVAVVANGRPDRRANPFTHYDGSPTPGCLYDLAPRNSTNDQLTLFAPSGLKGEVASVRILRDGSSGEAAIETTVDPALNRGLGLRHEYRLRDGWHGLLVVTTVKNQSDRPHRFDPSDRWSSLTRISTLRGYTLGEAMNPADKTGYALRWIETEGFIAPPDEIELAPHSEITYARGFTVADSPAAAFGRLAQRLEGTSMIHASLRDPDGHPIVTARVDFLLGDGRASAFPDAQGNFEFPLPFGDYRLVVTDPGRPSITNTTSVHPDRDTRLELTLARASGLRVRLEDELHRPLPGKLQFIGTNGTESPNLGPANRARGCANQYHSPGPPFTVHLPPGDYHVVATHGPEFAHLARHLHIPPETIVDFHAILQHQVDSRGWISADFHSHSTESGDNNTAIEDRLINLAAEHIEFAPATEHNRVVDWSPYLARLGLSSHLATLPGIELTGNGPHLNAFPFEPHPRTQHGGSPPWFRDPRINALLLREHQESEPARWVHLNHPDMIESWIDRDGDGRMDGGFTGLTPLLDAAEMAGPGILTALPYQLFRTGNGKETVGARREFVWLQLLNRGFRLPLVAVSDAHGVYESGTGGWRTYVRCSTDDPARIDWREITRHAKAGHSFVTTGPFLHVTTEDGTGPGDSIRRHAGLKLHVRVQCADWFRIDRIQVLVNGRQPPKLNFTRTSHPHWFRNDTTQFDREIGVPLSEDAHVIVVAIGEHSDLRIGFGSTPAGRWQPLAYHNPIYVDVDGNGWSPNGDLLGWDLPVRRLDPEEVRDLLEQHTPKPTP